MPTGLWKRYRKVKNIQRMVPHDMVSISLLLYQYLIDGCLSKAAFPRRPYGICLSFDHIYDKSDSTVPRTTVTALECLTLPRPLGHKAVVNAVNSERLRSDITWPATHVSGEPR